MTKDEFSILSTDVFQNSYEEFQKKLEKCMNETIKEWNSQVVKAPEALSSKLFYNSLFLSTTFTYEFTHALLEKVLTFDQQS